MLISFTLEVNGETVAQFRDGALSQWAYLGYINDIAVDGEQDICLRDHEGREIFRNTISRVCSTPSGSKIMEGLRSLVTPRKK